MKYLWTVRYPPKLRFVYARVMPYLSGVRINPGEPVIYPAVGTIVILKNINQLQKLDNKESGSYDYHLFIR